MAFADRKDTQNKEPKTADELYAATMKLLAQKQAAETKLFEYVARFTQFKIDYAKYFGVFEEWTAEHAYQHYGAYKDLNLALEDYSPERRPLHTLSINNMRDIEKKYNFTEKCSAILKCYADQYLYIGDDKEQEKAQNLYNMELAYREIKDPKYLDELSQNFKVFEKLFSKIDVFYAVIKEWRTEQEGPAREASAYGELVNHITMLNAIARQKDSKHAGVEKLLFEGEDKNKRSKKDIKVMTLQGMLRAQANDAKQDPMAKAVLLALESIKNPSTATAQIVAEAIRQQLTKKANQEVKEIEKQKADHMHNALKVIKEQIRGMREKLPSGPGMYQQEPLHAEYKAVIMKLEGKKETDTTIEVDEKATPETKLQFLRDWLKDNVEALELRIAFQDKIAEEHQKFLKQLEANLEKTLSPTQTANVKKAR